MKPHLRPFSCSLVLALAATAHAEAPATDNAAAAEALFREGRAAMKAGDYGTACPKLATSYELDPGTGALLALALCYEESGRLASAWSAYVEAETRSKREERPERAESARLRLDALEPRLPRISIRLSPELSALPGLQVERNGTRVPGAALGTAIPVDPGKQKVVVSATGYESATKELDATEGKVIEIVFDGALARLSAGAEASAADHRGGLGGLAIAGLVTGGVGVVGLGVGGVFGIVAMGKNSDSEADCDGNVCGPQGFQDRSDARSAGDLSTVFFVAGGVLAAAGATMFVLGLGEREGESASTTVGAYPLVGPGLLGAGLGARF